MPKRVDAFSIAKSCRNMYLYTFIGGKETRGFRIGRKGEEKTRGLIVPEDRKGKEQEFHVSG